MLEFNLSLATFLQNLLYYILNPIYKYIYSEKPPSTPPIKNPLLKQSATALAKKIREGELTSLAVVEAFIERIKEVNPLINAAIDNRFEAALNDAKTCDETIKSGKIPVATLEKEKPFYGVPCTVKESLSCKGLSFTGCNFSRRGMKAITDCPAVESLKNAGFIPLCVTNTPEFCCSLHTSNLLFGSTNNPYDRRYSPGGSSGGEAALIAAGGAVLGLGSDLVGSVRLPAHFTGIFGHKPSSGVVPVEGHYPSCDNPTFKKYLVVGPIARYAEDLPVVLKILSAKSGVDLRLDVPVDVRKLRVFYTDNIASFLGIRATCSAIRQKIKEAVHYMGENGATVNKFPHEWLADIYHMEMACIFGLEGLPQLVFDPNDPKHKKNSTLEFVKSWFGLSQNTKSAIFMQMLMDHRAFLQASRIPYYQDQVEQLRIKFNDLLKDDGVLICPTYPLPTFFQDLIPFKSDSSVYCVIANLLQLPATHVPMGLNKKGLPIGFQVIAGYRQDRVCLAVAKDLERAFGGWTPVY